MNKIIKAALNRSRINSEYFASNQRCLTPGTHYTTKIKPHKVTCKVKLPPSVRLNLTEFEAKVLDERIHRALEGVLAIYFE
mgnify:CR=1 FL=1